MKPKRPFLHASRLPILVIGLVLAACQPSVRPFGETPPFRAPTAIPSPTATQPAAAVSPTPPGQLAPDATCQDSLTFIADQTIPDGTAVGPESTLDKRWEVENTGNCNWDAGYRVRLIAGPDLGAQQEQALFPARSGSRAVIRLVFKAPSEPGNYRSAWQAFNPQGEPFGDPFFIDITVN